MRISAFSFPSFLRHYYAASFFYDLIFAYAVYNVFFSLRGLSVWQISLLLAWWALAAMVMEIPTGALADSWSRKNMLTIAPLIKAVCFVIWFLANGNFYLFALGFTFWALSSSLVSGTTEAMLYDACSHAGEKDEYEKFLGRKKFYFNIALAISMILGGFMAYFKIEWAIILSVIPLLLSSFFAWRIPEVPKVQSTGEIHYLRHIKTAFGEIASNRILIYLTIYLLVISIFGSLEEFDQLYYQLAGLPLWAFGVAGFIWSMLNATGAFYAHKLKQTATLFYLLPFVSGLLLIFVAKYPSIPLIGLLLATYFLTTPLRIVVEGKIQHAIKTDSRATVTSTSALFINLFGVVVTLLFGWISTVWQLPAIYLSTAVLLIIFSGWVYAQRDKFGFANE